MSTLERYDAILAHVYMMRPSERRFRSSLRGHLQVSALTHLYREGRVGKIFIAGGRVWGEEYPSLAEIMGQELERKSIDPAAIIVKPKAKDTPKEVDLFLEEASKMNWQKIASLANSSHQGRIKNVYQRRHVTVDHLSAERVLHGFSFNGRFPYRRFLKRFQWSRMELVFKMREAVVSFLYRIGFEKTLTKFAQSNRVQQFKTPFDS